MGYIQPQVQTGTVTNFKGAVDTGLLQTLVDFVTSDSGTPGLDWTVELNQPSKEVDAQTNSYDTTYREVILSNTGISGEENILVGIREYKYESTNEWGWELNGYLSVPAGWNSHAGVTHELDGWDSDRSHWNELPILQLFDNEIAYWFYSTQEYIQVAVRIGTSYFQCYLGHGKRLGSPSEYPHPLVVAGSEKGNTSYQSGGYGPVRPKWSGSSTSVSTGYYSMFFVTADGNFVHNKDFGHNAIALPMNQDFGSQDHAWDDNTTISGTKTDNAALLIPAFYCHENSTYLQLHNMVVFRKESSQSEAEYEDENGNLWRSFAQGKNDYNYDFLAILETVGSTTTTSSTTTTT